jgi:hypothetical protein
MNEKIQVDDISVVDEPQENESQLPSANIYYSTPSTKNRIDFFTKISSQISALYLDIDDDQSWYWSDRWQAMEREATKNLQEGDYEEFSDINDFIVSL